MGVFGIDTFREPSLIPPDEPETTECETERSEHLRRHVYKDGHIEWERLPHDPVGYEQDVLEEAYLLGQESNERQLRNLRANMKDALTQAQANGAFQAAVTAYERVKR